MGTTGGLFVVLILFLVLLGAVLYFLPSIVAFNRKHQNAGAILLLNIFLGWTFIGWVVSLVWSMTQVQQRETWGGSRENKSF